MRSNDRSHPSGRCTAPRYGTVSRRFHRRWACFLRTLKRGVGFLAFFFLSAAAFFLSAADRGDAGRATNGAVGGA